jgi:Ca2+-binding RTX toxin-like protein
VAARSYTLGHHVENLVAYGWRGFSGTGNGGDNMILGGYAKDRLAGMGGDDLLRGRSGEDRLVGGAGDDALFLAATGETYCAAVPAATP